MKDKVCISKYFSIYRKRGSQFLGFNGEIGFIRILMMITGLWPFEKHGNIIFSIPFVLIIIIMPPAMKSYFIKWKNEGVYQCLFAHLLIFMSVRIVLFKFRELEVEGVLMRMKKDWERAEYLNYEKIRIMNNYAKEAQYVVMLVLFLTVSANIFVPFLPWITSVITNKPVKLYMEAWYPFSLEKTYFQVISTLQFFSIMYTGLFIACLEGFFVIVVNHCRGQVKILCLMIIRNNGRILHYNPGNIDEDEMKRDKYNCSCTRCIVKRHTELIQFFGSIKELFNASITLGMINVFTLGIIALIMFSQEVDHDSFLFPIIGCLYVLGSFLFGFVYCWAGEKMTGESRALNQTLFDRSGKRVWRSDTSFLILLIYSLNRPMIITFGRYFELSHRLIKEATVLGYSIVSFMKGLSTNI